MELDPEAQALVALHLVPGIGPRLTTALLEHFGSAQTVLKASPRALAEVPRLGNRLASSLHDALQGQRVRDELALAAEHQVSVATLGSADYPQRLATIPDPPYVLYLRGSWVESDERAVAIVGSRHCTPYGRRVAERLARELVQAGFAIVSGLARGIDAVAHQAALDAGGRTIAVLAGGLSRIYPPEHVELARAVASAGALVTESPMALQPLPQTFPARNRLISGLSRGVVVVEAAAKSGALLTAKHAAEQGREVLAVPGNVDSEASGGTLKLIRDGATLVRDAADVLEALGERRGTAAAAAPAPAAAQLTFDEQSVWNLLAGDPPSADEIAEQSGLAITDLGSILTSLELRGLVRRLPGNRFERRR